MKTVPYCIVVIFFARYFFLQGLASHEDDRLMEMTFVKLQVEVFGF
jgi:hypothetical protein